MQAAEAMARGIENADRDAEIRCLPMADGGEGTVRALVDATGGRCMPCRFMIRSVDLSKAGSECLPMARPPRPAVSPDSTRRNETR